MNNYEKYCERAIEEAQYIIENKCTIRATAKALSISKSTIHKDVTDRLRRIDLNLYQKVRLILNENFKQRHIRGGISTANKHKGACRQ